MREFTKSLGSFSLALSTFGAQQLLNLARQPLPSSDHPSTASLDAVARSAEQQLGDLMQRTFDVGDRAQRSGVDLLFVAASRDALDPNRWIELSSDLLRRSTAAVTGIIPGCEADTDSSCGSRCGWGPMPPAS